MSSWNGVANLLRRWGQLPDLLPAGARFHHNGDVDDVSAFSQARRSRLIERALNVGRIQLVHSARNGVDPEPNQSAQYDIAYDPAANAPIHNDRLRLVAVKTKLDRMLIFSGELLRDRRLANIGAINDDIRATWRRSDTDLLRRTVDDRSTARNDNSKSEQQD